MDFLLEVSVWDATLIVVTAILLDAVLGILKTFKKENENFDIRSYLSSSRRMSSRLLVVFLSWLWLWSAWANLTDGLFYPIAVAVLAEVHCRN